MYILCNSEFFTSCILLLQTGARPVAKFYAQIAPSRFQSLSVRSVLTFTEGAAPAISEPPVIRPMTDAECVRKGDISLR